MNKIQFFNALYDRKEGMYGNQMVLVIIPIPQFTNKRKLNIRLWIIMTTSICLRLLINSHVWSTIRWWNITNHDKLKIQFVHARLCLLIFHLQIWDTQNKWKGPHDRKEIISIVKEVMANEASKERPRMQQKVNKTKKYRDNKDDTNETEGFEMK